MLVTSSAYQSIVVVVVVAKVPEIHEDGEAEKEGFPLGVPHSAEIELVIVHVGCEEELAAARHLLLKMSDAGATRHVGDWELDLCAGPTRQRAAQAPLAATSVCQEHLLVVLVAHMEREIAARKGIREGSDFLVRGHVHDINRWSIEAEASARPRPRQFVNYLLVAILRIHDVQCPRRTIGAALFQLTRTTIGRLHSVEELLGSIIAHDLILVG